MKALEKSRKGIMLAATIGLILLLQRDAKADGGGPILLLINFSAFMWGSLIIIVEEWLIYKYMFKNIRIGRAFWDVLIANISSTIVIGLGFPLLIAILSWLGRLLGGEIGNYIFAAGTWVAGDNSPHPMLALCATAIWFIVTFFMTVYFEARVIKKLWKKRNNQAEVSPMRWSWTANIVSYITLILITSIFMGWASQLIQYIRDIT